MMKFWVYNTLKTVLYIMAVIVFYLTSFSNKGLWILILAAVILSGLSLLNYKVNYKKIS